MLSINAQSTSAHQKGLFTIGGKDFLLVAGSQNEPVFDFFALGSKWIRKYLEGDCLCRKQKSNI
ncbi:MAG: hypothetical protein WA631_19755 [Nitrososphaeraceae archaeon]